MRILFILIAAILLTSTASAYVPKEYVSEVHNDVELYLLSMKHFDEHWAQDNLDQLAINYTNNGRWDQLVTKMEAILNR